MNNRFVSEPFVIPADRLDAFKAFCKKHKISENNYLIDGVRPMGVSGSKNKHFSPDYNPEFKTFLPQGGVLFYDIRYKYNRYWGLCLERVGGEFLRMTVQNNDYFSVFSELNDELANLVAKPPTDGVLFVSAAFGLNNQNNSSRKTLIALAENTGCKVTDASINANSSCFRLTGLVTKDFDPRTSAELGKCMDDSGGMSETLFYFMTFSAGKCTRLGLYNKPCSYRTKFSDRLLSLLGDIPLPHGLEGFTKLNAKLAEQVSGN